LFALMICFNIVSSQKMTVTQMKVNIENASNPLVYVRDVLKKKYILDTILVLNATHFRAYSDSLAYYGKVKKVYGPVANTYLVQILAKLPNSFTRISQIFIDTTVFTRRIADSLANSIVQRIKSGKTSFEDMAQAYSMGGEAATKGDIGWVARGAMIPEMEKELAKRKKGEVFKIWSRTGVHIIKKTSEPKQDNGFALMMRVVL
jgi:parvulin-like peptidyl-prolyl isomerase